MAFLAGSKTNKRHSTIAFAIVCLSALLAVTTFAEAGALENEGLSIEALIRMDGTGIAACGLTLQLNRADHAPVTVEIYNDKTDNGTRTVLRLQPHADSAVRSVRITTPDHDTDTLLTPRPSDSTGFAAAANLDPDTIGPLFRALLVSGFDVELTTKNGLRRWTQQGPAPHSVRQLYLMCSGDLYRP